METIAKIISSLLRSMIVSIVIFFVLFTLVTQEFPPKISKITEAWNGLQQLSQIQTNQRNNQNLNNDDQMINELEEVDKRKREISKKLFSQGEKNSKNKIKTDDFNSDLEKDIQKMKMQIIKLDNRIEQLEILLKKK